MNEPRRAQRSATRGARCAHNNKRFLSVQTRTQMKSRIMRQRNTAPTRIPHEHGRNLPRCRTRLLAWASHFEPSTGRLNIRSDLRRARSRLYRSEVLQENMRLKALTEIYTMHSFAQLGNLIFFSKFCQNFLQNSVANF